MTTETTTTTETPVQATNPLLQVAHERALEKSRQIETDEPTGGEAEDVAPPEGEEEKPEAKPDVEDEVLRARIEIKERTKRLQKRERKLDQQLRDLEARSAAVKEIEELRTLWERDPYAFIEKANIDPRKWAERALATAKEPDPMSEVAALRAQIQEFQERQEREALETKRTQQERALVGYIESRFEEDKAMYESIAVFIDEGEFSANDLARKAYEDILTHYKETGEELDLSAVLGEYDRQLRQRVESAARRWQRLNKQASEVKPSPKPNGSDRAQLPKAEKRETRTLTNRDAVTKVSQATTKEDIKAAVIEKYLRRS